MEQFLDGSQVNILVAFVAGFVTFFASCLLPLIPTYLAYLSGVSLTTVEASKQRWGIVRVAAFFVAGFISTFVVLGMLLNQFAGLVADFRPIITRLSGLFFMLMGLFMIGAFQSQALAREFKVDIQGMFKKQKHLHAFLTGIAFGFGWTPCIGPILALILVWSANQATMLNGVILLISYGLGLGLPFLLVAVGFEHAVPFLKKYNRVTQYATILSGLIVIFAGVLLFFGQFQQVSFYLLRIFQLEKFAR